MYTIADKIRSIPDFPQKGVLFKDITPLLQDPQKFKKCVDWYCQRIEELGGTGVLAGIEARGFIFAAAIAARMNLGLTLIRKPGKLPAKTEKIEYNLEYGRGSLELHSDALQKDQQVIIIDDLLATGGTVNAATILIKKINAKSKAAIFLIELKSLKGREKIPLIPKQNIISMIQY